MDLPIFAVLAGLFSLPYFDFRLSEAATMASYCAWPSTMIARSVLAWPDWRQKQDDITPALCGSVLVVLGAKGFELVGWWTGP